MKRPKRRLYALLVAAMTSEAITPGVSLAKYAAVNAATTEGFALPDVLAVEGLGVPAWKEADAGLKVKLTREPAALASYTAELAAAEDWLSRRVTPLEDDPDAWVAFLHAFANSSEPLALLEMNRLGMNDISRLTRHWARRIEQEPALEKNLAKLARVPSTLPRIEVEPAVLRRSREAEAAQPAMSAEEAPSSSVAGRRALAAHREVLHALAAKRAQAEPDVWPRSSIAVGASADPEPAALPPGMRGFLNISGTQIGPAEPPTKAVLPFDPHASPQLPAPGEAPEWMPKGMRGFVDIGSTQAAPDVPSGPPLPFVPVPPANVEALPPGMRGFLNMHGTQLSPEAPPVGPVLPFEPAGPLGPSVSSIVDAALVKPRSATSLIPEGMRHFKSLTDTEVLLDAGQRPTGPLPFASARPNAPPPNVGAALPSPVPRLTLEQYAQMCVELALYPAHRSDIYRRYGIDDEQRSRLDGYWGARVRENASMKAVWDRQYAEHWTRLRGPQGSKR